MNVTILVALSLGVALILSEIFYRLKYPRVIGQILAGVIFSLPVFYSLFTDQFRQDVAFLSDLGLIFLMLIAGLSVNLGKLEKTSKDSLLISLFSVIIPFCLGFLLIILLDYLGILNLSGHSLYTVAAVVGAALSITAEGTTLKVLMEMRALNTKVGTIILGAGLLDDVFEIIFLAVLLMYVHKTLVSLALFPVMIAGFVFIVFLTMKVVPTIIKLVQKERSRVATVSTMIVITLAIAGLSQLFGLSPIIGAFLAGIIIQWANKDKYDEQEDVKELKAIAFSLVVPFFFINIGLHFNLHSLWTNPLLFVAVLIVAIAGKLFGSIVVTPISDLSFRQAMLIGWGMNSRGAIELVIAEIARINNLIPIGVYSAIVATAVVTTVIFPFVLRRQLHKDRSIMD